jgi:hypothetical protein
LDIAVEHAIFSGMNVCFRPLVALGLCLLGASLHAASLAVGDAAPAFSVKDQHGAEFVFTNGVRFLLVATEMASGKSANLKLAEQGAGFLEKHQAVYLMDIHSMPGVARMFALPKLRRYPQRILLVEKAETLSTIPARPARVTVLALTPAGRVRNISYWDPVREPVADYLQ